MPADDDYVKRIKIQSEILTKWWGQPIYIGATSSSGITMAPRREVSVVYDLALPGWRAWRF